MELGKKLSLSTFGGVVLSWMMVFICGCVNTRGSRMMDGRALINRLALTRKKEAVKSKNDVAVKRVTFSALNMAISDFSSWVSTVFGVGVVYNRDLDGLLVTTNFYDASLDEILLFLARRYGVHSVRTGNTYYLGSSRPSDKYVIVRSFSGFPVEDVKGFLSLFSGGGSNTYVTSSRVGFVNVDGESLAKTVAAIDDFLSMRPRRFLCNLVVVRRDESMYRKYGFRVASVGSIDALLDGVTKKGLGLVFSPDLDYSVLVGSVKDEITFSCVEGMRGEYRRGSEMRYKKSVVSQYGVSSDSSSEILTIGLNFSVMCSLYDDGFITVDYNYKDSKISGYMDNGYPVLGTLSANGSVVCKDGLPSLLAVLTSDGDIKSVNTLLLSRDVSKVEYLLYLCVSCEK